MINGTRRIRARWIGILAAAGIGVPAHAADSVSERAWLLDWRVRHETVEQAGLANNADALTSRLRAGFETTSLASTRLLVEVVGIADLRDDYDDTLDGRTQYPVVADPSFAAVNRFAFTNASLERTRWTIGRQRIIHDDARFVGNVGWRQNEQTYDAVRMVHTREALEAELTYAGQVNRIFGPDSPAGRWTGDIVMARLAVPIGAGELTGFHYLLEIDEAPGASSRTTGLRLTGARPGGDVELGYALAVARQSDAGANTASFAETYLFAEGRLGLQRLALALGYERLGGNGTSAVSTPLATLHAFQGWADRFLATPPSGLEDRFIRVGYALGPVGPFSALNVTAVQHDFRADAGSADLGEETDLVLVARADRFALTLKYASYEGGGAFADTDKAWASFEYSW